eukprot:TRINITY_DN34313_c0_g1_i1.p1 TRINITY_DN34313_c0_g1~~TRINITY_DN34313_c0_g1_i1.p1  ORF type:complete len:251 (-),score=52.40 TRINITY_DN34313_c0_g1_i1:74-826(-)
MRPARLIAFSSIAVAAVVGEEVQSTTCIDGQDGDCDVDESDMKVSLLQRPRRGCASFCDFCKQAADDNQKDLVCQLYKCQQCEVCTGGNDDSGGCTQRALPIFSKKIGPFYSQSQAANDAAAFCRGSNSGATVACLEKAEPIYEWKKNAFYDTGNAVDDSVRWCKNNANYDAGPCLVDAAAAYKTKVNPFYDQGNAVDDGARFCSQHPKAGGCLKRGEKYYYDNKHGPFYDHGNSISDAKRDCSNNPYAF